MKTISLAVLITVALSGCTLPEKAYHAVAVSKRRSQAVPPESVQDQVVVNHTGSKVHNLDAVQLVVVLARDPDEAVPTRSRSSFIHQPSPIRQATESVLQRAMLERGFRVANRMALQPVLEDASIQPPGSNSVALFRVVAPTHLLVLTRVRQNAEPVKYEWYEGFVGETKSWMVGTRVDYYLTLELMDAVTSEALWSASAQLNALLAGNPSEAELLDKLTRKLAASLPAASAQPALTIR